MPEKILILANEAREEITIERLKKQTNSDIHSYLNIPNPGIMRFGNYKIGSYKNIKKILTYVKKNNFDYVLSLMCQPMEFGLADALKDLGVKCFGPVKKAAMLETRKSFTRDLINQVIPEVNPTYATCSDLEEAIKVIHKLEYEVAVKPTCLTNGLGVKVYGEQLFNRQEVEHYAEQILKNNRSVIIEEKLNGVEFTVHYFIDGQVVIDTPPVQDYKKLLSGEKGVNTGSMGSICWGDDLLPFIKPKDHEQAKIIVEKVISQLKKIYNVDYLGVVCGQFILTKNGLKVIEFNVRPGDPEWLNTMMSMETPLMDVIQNIQDCPKIKFKKGATVSKYIVPQKYPYEMNLVLPINLTKFENNDNFGVYHSCFRQADDRLNVGDERGIVVVARAETIKEAKQKVEKFIATIEGDFHFRRDIGTPKLLKEKIEYANYLRSGK